MYGVNLSKRLVDISNEQRAQKSAYAINYGSLAVPSNTPTKTWYGHISNSVSTIDDNVVARWVAKFERTDGIDGAPIVDFPWNYVLDRYLYDDQIAAGNMSSVSGRDKHANDEVSWNEGLYEIGNNYVSWKIELVGAQGNWYYLATNGTGVHLTCQAVSPVPGNLILTKVA